MSYQQPFQPGGPGGQQRPQSGKYWTPAPEPPVVWTSILVSLWGCAQYVCTAPRTELSGSVCSISELSRPRDLRLFLGLLAAIETALVLPATSSTGDT